MRRSEEIVVENDHSARPDLIRQTKCRVGPALSDFSDLNWAWFPRGDHSQLEVVFGRSLCAMSTCTRQRTVELLLKRELCDDSGHALNLLGVQSLYTGQFGQGRRLPLLELEDIPASPAAG